MKPFLPDKTVTQGKIALLDKNLPVTKEKKAETLINFFAEVLVNLNITSYESYPASIDTNVDPMTNIIEKYKEHPSIVVIKYVAPCQSFSSQTVDRDKIIKEIKNFKLFKAIQESDISRKIVKENC